MSWINLWINLLKFKSEIPIKGHSGNSLYSVVQGNFLYHFIRPSWYPLEDQKLQIYDFIYRLLLVWDCSGYFLGENWASEPLKISLRFESPIPSCCPTCNPRDGTKVSKSVRNDYLQLIKLLGTQGSAGLAHFYKSPSFRYFLLPATTTTQKHTPTQL